MNFKRYLVTAGSVIATGLAFAEDSAGFNPSEFLSSANTTVGTVVTAVGTLLATALGLYLAFVGYRKAKEALNKA